MAATKRRPKTDAPPTAEPPSTGRGGLHAILLALIVMAALTLAVTSVRDDSATADEGAHIAAGLLKITKGWLHFYGEQSLLPDDIVALPLVLAGYQFSPAWGGDPWTVGRQFLYDAGYDPQRTLLLARIPSLLAFGGTLLLIYFFVARETQRREWALVATAMAAFCPTLMAHGRLATADMTPTFFLFAATMLFFRLAEHPTIPRSLAFGAVAALAVLAKMSSLILGPFVVLLLFAMRKRIEWRPMLTALCAATLLGIVMLELLYVSQAGPEFLATQANPSRFLIGFRTFLHQLGAINYYYTGEHGHAQFLMGEFSSTGWRHYYLAALFLKTPIPAQLLFVFAVIRAFRGGAPFALRAMLLFVALFLAAASMSKVALGVRYVLPMFPFAFAAMGVALGEAVGSWQLAVGSGKSTKNRPGSEKAAERQGFIHRQPPTANRQLVYRVLLIALVAWQIGANLTTWPSYIAYFNTFIGDREKDDLLIDSNLDWGQDLHRLARWKRDNQVGAMAVHYFGGGDPSYELGPGAVLWAGPNGGPLPRGWFALSRHYYRLSFDRAISPVSYDEYLSRSRARFVTTIGGSIDLYRVD
ncbi:MAG TPA: glycosyltransferase family 39 protein [Thermoanaerobaculia bacterium]